MLSVQDEHSLLKKGFSINLDLLRAIAVLSVYFSHLYGLLIDRSYGSLGRFGVILFFVHTSIVLMASIRRLEAEHSNNTTLFFAFWLKRIFRIYPLAIVTVILIPIFHIPTDPSVLYAWIGMGGFLANIALIQNLFVTQNILASLWSLPLEVQMYALLPFAYLAIRGRRRYRSLGLWIFSVLLALTLPRLNWRLSVFAYAPCFTSGIVAFDLLRSRTSTWKLPAWVWPTALFVAIALFQPHDNLHLDSKMYRAWALSLMLGLAYAFTSEASHNWMHRIFRWIAERSYGIYLSHLIVFWVVFRQMESTPLWIRVITLIVASIGVPALAYVSIEKPLILMGNHVARRLLRQHNAR